MCSAIVVDDSCKRRNSVMRVSTRMVKSVFIELGADDKKAKNHIRESLSACDWHILSRKLLDRFSTASGPMFAIAADWIHPDQLAAYSHGSVPPASAPPYATGDYPQDRLVAFVRDYLQTTKDGVVVCENWGAERKDIVHWPWPPPRVACYGDKEVYHLVTPDITDPEMIEAAVETRHHWQTNVCSSCAHVPEGDIPDDAFLDEIVLNTKHIFLPAFDGSGYLIWSPELPSAHDEKTG